MGKVYVIYDCILYSLLLKYLADDYSYRCLKDCGHWNLGLVDNSFGHICAVSLSQTNFDIVGFDLQLLLV